MSHRESTLKALNRFYKKEHDKILKEQGPRRRNKKPEKLVEKACLEWMRSLGWDVLIYEAKAKCIGGVWRASGVKTGVCDCQGLTNLGEPCFIEFKSPGKRSSFNRKNNHSQREYLLAKLELGAFAVVVDSVELLEKTYREWSVRKAHDSLDAKLFLKSALPQKHKFSTSASDLDW